MPKLVLCACTVVLFLSGTVQAALEEIGNGLINDSVLGITWLKDANMVKTSCDANDVLWQEFDLSVLKTGQKSMRDKERLCSSGGYLNWYEAKVWIALLNAYNYKGYDDWQLPETNPVNGTNYKFDFLYDGSADAGYNISAPDSAYPGSTGSWLAHLHYNSLGNGSLYSPGGTDQRAKVCPAPDYCLQHTGPFENLDPISYWSGTDDPLDPKKTWYFSTGFSRQLMGFKHGYNLRVWPVRPKQSVNKAKLEDLGNGLVNDHTLKITWMKDANMVKTSCDANDALWREFDPETVQRAHLPPRIRSKETICSDHGGLLKWYEAKAWIAVLNSHNYLGYNDWRLPATNPVNGREYNFGGAVNFDGSKDMGYNVSAPGSAYPGSTGSELAHMHYNSLGNGSHYSVGGHEQQESICPHPNMCMQHTGPFNNLRSYKYWSGTEENESGTRSGVHWDTKRENAWAFSNNRGYQGFNNKFDYLFHVWPVRSGLSKVRVRLDDIGNGLINDHRLKVTWMKDANMVKTSCDAHDALWQAFNPGDLPPSERSNRDKASICADNGRLNWYEAKAWIKVLNSHYYKGYTDWRQPAIKPMNGISYIDRRAYDGSTDHGYNIHSSASELADLHYNSLGNPSMYSPAGIDQQDTVCPPPNHCVRNRGPFDNFYDQDPEGYWSRTTQVFNDPLRAHDEGYALSFDPYDGYQGYNDKNIARLYIWPVRSGLSEDRSKLDDLGNGLVNDTALNITWLKDANMVKTSCDANDDLWKSFDPEALPEQNFVAKQHKRDKATICAENGRLNWYEAEAWIAVLNDNHYKGYADWRQQATNPLGRAIDLYGKTYDGSTDRGYNNYSTVSELGNLHYNTLGNGSWYSDTGDNQQGKVCPAPRYCAQHTGPFDNLQSDSYWSGTTHVLSPHSYSVDMQYAWYFSPYNGYLGWENKNTNNFYVWPVRYGLSGRDGAFGEYLRNQFGIPQ